MKPYLTTSVFACLLISTLAIGSGSGDNRDIGVALANLKGLRVARNKAFDANYPGTQCVDIVLVKSGKKSGLICRSRNKRFIGDMGIKEFDELLENARPKLRPSSGLVVATPMAQYSMELMPGTKSRVAAAMVDCDISGGPVYRATATCHVATTRPSEDEFLYSIVVVKSHTTDRLEMTHAQILEMWRRLGSP